MKLSETLLLGASAAFMVIGIHQAIHFGLQNSYFFFMVSTGLFLWYSLKKKKAEQEESKGNKKNKPAAKSKK